MVAKRNMAANDIPKEIT